MASLFRKLGFHANDKPRAWLKSLVFDDQLSPRPFFQSWVEPRVGDIHPAFRSWRLMALQNPAPSPMNDWPLRRQDILKQKTWGSSGTLHIVCTRATTFVAHALQTHVSALGFAVHIEHEMPEDYSDDLYLVICPQMFSRLPPREQRIVFQMEQSVHPRWFTTDYLNILYNSMAVFDYSVQNIHFLIQQGIPAHMVFHVPLSPVPHYLGAEFTRSLSDDERTDTCDVLFYGDWKNKRRQAFLKVLSQHFDVRAERSLYGHDLWRAMARAKVVVNIHYYENALLESTRICECLSLGARVVSESATDQGQHPDWEDMVVFTPINDAQAMVQAIRQCLQQTHVAAYAPQERPYRMGSAIETAFRALNLLASNPPTPIICAD